MKDLLRVAPWADLDEIREKLIVSVNEYLSLYPRMKNTKDVVDSYIAGERPTIPNIDQLKYRLDQILSEQYYPKYNDRSWGSAYAEIIRYFFFEDYWLV
jgi:hypothetical protein